VKELDFVNIRQYLRLRSLGRIVEGKEELCHQLSHSVEVIIALQNLDVVESSKAPNLIRRQSCNEHLDRSLRQRSLGGVLDGRKEETKIS
jgi:hypothetical protein